MSPLIRTQRQTILRQIFQFEKINKNKLNVAQTQEYLDQNIQKLCQIILSQENNRKQLDKKLINSKCHRLEAFSTASDSEQHEYHYRGVSRNGHFGW